ncbi:MAG: Maf family protein [Caulobacteraceae bacterium]
MSEPVTLASTSSTRRKVLTGAGVAFEAVSPGVDEGAIKASLLAEGATPRDIADALAELKAVKASNKRSGLVIGCDQTLELEGQTFDKAEDLAQARAHLQALRGKAHTLHAAVVVAKDGAPIWREVKSARLTMRSFTDDYLDGYLAREGDAILGSVGCYRLESEGVQLFERIDGDYFAILGLPLMGLLEFLRLHGVLSR